MLPCLRPLYRQALAARECLPRGGTTQRQGVAQPVISTRKGTPPALGSMSVLRFVLLLLLLPVVAAAAASTHESSSSTIVADIDKRLLSPAEMLECYNRMDAHLTAFHGTRSHPLPRLEAEHFQDEKVLESLRPIMTKSYCTDVVGLLGFLVTDKKISKNSSPEHYRRVARELLGVDVDEEEEADEETGSSSILPSTVGDKATRQLEGKSHQHRELAAVQYKGDVDPDQTEFTKDALGTGYDLFTVGSGVQCSRFSPNSCDNGATGSFYFGWFAAQSAYLAAGKSPVAPSLAALVTYAIFGPLDGVKEAIDYASLTLKTVKGRQTFLNVKNIINNQELIFRKTQAIADAAEGVVEQTAVVGSAVDTLAAKLLAALRQVKLAVEALAAGILQQINNALTVVYDAMKTALATIINKIRNVEARIIANVINALLDKFSIDGANRLNRLPVPNAARRKLFEAYHEAMEAAKAASQESRDLTDSLTPPSAEEDDEEEGGEAGLGRKTKTRNMQQQPPPAIINPRKYLYGYGCDSNDNDNNLFVDECEEDKFPPIISTDQFLESTRGVWFDSVARVSALARGLISGDDDCGAVTFTQPSVSGSCQNGQVFVTATDRCGANVVNATVPVWIDLARPTVSFDLTPEPTLLERADPLTFTKCSKLVDVGLDNIRISDNCDPQPYVQLNVYSDELPYSNKAQLVVIVRRFENRRLIGWRILVKAGAALTCKDTACDVPDGRVYTISLCAKDQAGHQTCTQRTIGVGFGKDKPAPVSQGPVFKLAHDAGFLNAEPADDVASFSPNKFIISA